MSRVYVLAIANLARMAIGRAIDALDMDLDFCRDADARRADPRLIDLALEIRHARTHLALAARKAAEIVAAPRAAEEGEP